MNRRRFIKTVAVLAGGAYTIPLKVGEKQHTLTGWDMASGEDGAALYSTRHPVGNMTEEEFRRMYLGTWEPTEPGELNELVLEEALEICPRQETQLELFKDTARRKT